MTTLEGAAETLARYTDHPGAMVREIFDLGEPVTPDLWQDDVLEAFPHNQRIAMMACKGPGKTAVLAWLILNFLLTRPFAKVGATSVSEDNINDNLWPELAKWMARSSILRDQFHWTKTRIVCKTAPENWFCSLRTWSRSANTEQQASTLAGFHADYVMFVLDESGDIPDAVMVSAEAALSSGKECHIVQAGNPTHLTGPLYRAATSDRHLWYVVHITNDPEDPRRSTRASMSYAREMIERWGRDNPWVMANVLGQFPPSSIDTLLGPDDLRMAEQRSWTERDIGNSPRILGVDVARFGDDASVLFPRQGLVAFQPLVWRNLDSTQGAGAVSRKWGDWGADHCFIDNTGGWGAGWIDALRTLGRGAVGINFSNSASDERYYNKRAEMYIELRDWVRNGGQLPHCAELVRALTQTTYTFRGDRLLLEDKGQLKDRIGFSPDHADALALTFAQRVGSPALNTHRYRAGRGFRSEVNPYEITPEEMGRYR